MAQAARIGVVQGHSRGVAWRDGWWRSEESILGVGKLGTTERSKVNLGGKDICSWVDENGRVDYSATVDVPIARSTNLQRQVSKTSLHGVSGHMTTADN